MACFIHLIGAAFVVILFASPGLAQTQPQQQFLGSQSPGTAAAWKKECESRADEKGFKGKKRKDMIAKCVKMGSLPPELR